MARSRLFYGWHVTIAFSLMVFASAGIRHAVGPFLKPMVADLHVDRASFSLCLLYTSPSPRDRQKSRMPSSA